MAKKTGLKINLFLDPPPYRLSHETRTVLAILESALAVINEELGMREPNWEKVNDYLEMIYYNALRLRNIRRS